MISKSAMVKFNSRYSNRDYDIIKISMNVLIGYIGYLVLTPFGLILSDYLLTILIVTTSTVLFSWLREKSSWWQRIFP